MTASQRLFIAFLVVVILLTATLIGYNVWLASQVRLLQPDVGYSIAHR